MGTVSNCAVNYTHRTKKRSASRFVELPPVPPKYESTPPMPPPSYESISSTRNPHCSNANVVNTVLDVVGNNQKVIVHESEPGLTTITRMNRGGANYTVTTKVDGRGNLTTKMAGKGK